MPAPPVLLVHGFGTSCDRTWRDNGWIDLLVDAGREVIGVDLLGHGGAVKPHDPDAYAGLEDAVAARLPEVPVDAVGFSLGARVVLTLAAEQPERFNRLVVAGVGANLFRHDDPEPLARLLADGGEPDEGNVALAYFAALARAPENDPLALAACLRRPAPVLTAERLARVTHPVLVVLGAEDVMGPADPLLDALPDARLVTLRGTDHMATPKDLRFLDATLDFLEALPA